MHMLLTSLHGHGLFAQLLLLHHLQPFVYQQLPCLHHKCPLCFLHEVLAELHSHKCQEHACITICYAWVRGGAHQAEKSSCKL